ncbi:hypothetical protein [Aquitalea sp. ASV15]|uniref:hypothetical protein n=1 Tax=Aquitalea sp. ASV15 TaxID=2795104 RepID=UPI0018EC5033|nr:hypothetical protein [Aquitalea sp. ASV15]
MKTRPVMTGHNHVHAMDNKKPCPHSQPRKTGLLIPAVARVIGSALQPEHAADGENRSHRRRQQTDRAQALWSYGSPMQGQSRISGAASKQKHPP